MHGSAPPAPAAPVEEKEEVAMEEEEEEVAAAETLSAADVAKMKVADLKEELTKRGLDTKGLKKDLAKRLVDALQ